MTISYWSHDLENSSIFHWVDSIDKNVPSSSGWSWRTVYYDGPVYAIDNDPIIGLECSNDYDNHVLIGADAPSHNYSYFSDETGTYRESNYEWMVQVLYEEIIPLNMTYIINENNITWKYYYYTSETYYDYDDIDAYFVNLTEGLTYNFWVEPHYANQDEYMDLDLTLYKYSSLTDEVLVESTGPSFGSVPIGNGEYADWYSYDSMKYEANETGVYVLLANSKEESYTYNIGYEIVDTKKINIEPQIPGFPLDLFLLIILSSIIIILERLKSHDIKIPKIN